MSVPLLSTAQAIRFPFNPFTRQFNSSIYTSTLTDERVSKDEIDQVLRQFEAVQKKLDKKLLYTIGLLLLIDLVICFCTTLNSKTIYDSSGTAYTGLVTYIDGYIVLVGAIIVIIVTTITFFMGLYFIYRMSISKKAAFQNLLKRINSDFADRDLKWCASLLPFSEAMILRKGYVEYDQIKFYHLNMFTQYDQFDSDSYMSVMTHRLISLDEVDQVMQAVKRTTDPFNKRLKRTGIVLLILSSLLAIPAMLTAIVRTSQGELWSVTIILFVVFIIEMSLAALVFFICSNRNDELKRNVVQELFDQLNPGFASRGFKWEISSKSLHSIELCKHHDATGLNEPNNNYIS